MSFWDTHVAPSSRSLLVASFARQHGPIVPPAAKLYNFNDQVLIAVTVSVSVFKRATALAPKFCFSRCKIDTTLWVEQMFRVGGRTV